jgi:hypothetical protein
LEKAKLQKVMLASFVTLQTMAPDNAGASSPSSNVKPVNNTTKNFAPNFDEVVNLTGLL